MNSKDKNLQTFKDLLLILGLVLLFFLVFFSAKQVYAEKCLFVTANQLNGRAEPNKRAFVEAVFECGDAVTPTGAISGEWIEVIGGETGTVWCNANYLSATYEQRVFVNSSNGRLHIRKSPAGEHVGWVQKGENVTVIGTLDGWAYVKSKGWVDMEFLSEADR